MTRTARSKYLLVLPGVARYDKYEQHTVVDAPGILPTRGSWMKLYWACTCLLVPSEARREK